ncbi:MAG TPA: flagellar biosynthesis anti-sigma factor FlgM [Terriglobales bacterium]|jgi:negative regulator of flagellin synthesis FlgM|nr:flagellar biosynthesis anti-sigma factor FlgM [Terriglobales bacterium]
MRIDLNLANTNSVDSSRPTKTNVSKSVDLSSVAARQDATQLSPEIQRVSALEAQLAQLPEVRSDRVAELQQAIRNGSYSVSADQIANSMLADSLRGRVRF